MSDTIHFAVPLKKKASEAHGMFVEVYADHALDYYTYSFNV